MGFWRKGDSDLERELRQQRPRPSDDFVRSLSRLVEPARRSRRLALPKLALVAAVTALLAVSLGVAGAFGYASHSVQAFGTSISHLVSTPNPASGATQVLLTQSSTQQSTSTQTNTNTNQGPPQEYENGGLHTPGIPPVFNFDFPFHHQYGILIPICWQGHLIFVTPQQLVWYIFHGAKPFWTCIPWPPHPTNSG